MILCGRVLNLRNCSLSSQIKLANMDFKKNDNVTIISGKDKGKSGKITKVFATAGQILIEGINMKKKHAKPKKSGEKGQIIQIAHPISASNAMITCSSCSKNTRIAKKIESKGMKVRVCKKCGAGL